MTEPLEPPYARQNDDLFGLGLRIGIRHSNARGLLHGAVISTLADNSLGLCCVLQSEDVSALIVHLSVEFLAVGQRDQWREAQARPLKFGKTIDFSEFYMFADDNIVSKVNVIFGI